jgi:phytoene dehydrogenase-like protein
VLWNRPLPGCTGHGDILAGLYLCGAGTHPGGDVCGAPGHNAARAVLSDLARAQLKAT